MPDRFDSGNDPVGIFGDNGFETIKGIDFDDNSFISSGFFCFLKLNICLMVFRTMLNSITKLFMMSLAVLQQVVSGN